MISVFGSLVGDEEIEKVSACMKSQWMGFGKQVEEFEKKLFRKKGDDTDIFYHYKNKIDDLKSQKSISTASNYDLAEKSLKAYLKFKKKFRSIFLLLLIIPSPISQFSRPRFCFPLLDSPRSLLLLTAGSYGDSYMGEAHKKAKESKLRGETRGGREGLGGAELQETRVLDWGGSLLPTITARRRTAPTVVFQAPGVPRASTKIQGIQKYIRTEILGIYGAPN